MNFRDRWPFRQPNPERTSRPRCRGPEPHELRPDPGDMIPPAAWQRHTPIQPWMTIPTDPRMPTQAATDTTEETPMTEPTTEEIQLPEPIPPQKPRCEHCGGPVPTINDHIRESIALISGVGDRVVADFYERLFSIAPAIRVIFPPDLLDAEEGSDTRGFRQRDELVKWLIRTAELYDPFNPKSMLAWDALMQSSGRRHHAFRMPDGTVFVPERKHYDAVTACLLDALRSAAGDKFRPEHEQAWQKAMDDSGDSMRHYARLWQSGTARLPRESAEPMRLRRHAPQYQGPEQ